MDVLLQDASIAGKQHFLETVIVIISVSSESEYAGSFMYTHLIHTTIAEDVKIQENLSEIKRTKSIIR